MMNKYEKPNISLHPNAFLARNPDLEELYCLYCEPPAADEAAGLCQGNVFRYRDGHVLIFTNPEGISELEALFSRAGTHAGICGPYTRALTAYGCAEKAYAAAEFGSELEPAVFLHHYANSRLWIFVELADKIITGENLSINDFCHGSVFDICEYDRLEGASYRSTLMAYLRAGCNLRAAAETIGVHRNTLAYRKKRLEELFDIDLNDANTCFELLFSIIALEASGIDWDAYRKPREGSCRQAELDRVLWQLAEHREITGTPDCVCRLLMMDVSHMQDDRIASLYRAAEERFPWSAAAYNDDFVYILSEARRAAPESFHTMLCEHGCRGAVSQPFQCARLGLHAELLSHILPATKRLFPDSALFMAKDYCSLAFFSYMQRRTPLEPYYCDEVMRVMDHDYKKGTTLAKSLYTYLSSFMDMIGAAHEASIHRNTLEYQIKKALAIANAPQPGDLLRFEMTCTYKMLIASED